MGARVSAHGPASREWRRHPGVQSWVSALVWVKLISSGRWIQCGGTAGHPLELANADPGLDLQASVPTRCGDNDVPDGVSAAGRLVAFLIEVGDEPCDPVDGGRPADHQATCAL